MKLPDLTDKEIRQFCTLIRNGLKVTQLDNGLRVKMAEWVQWAEYQLEEEYAAVS